MNETKTVLINNKSYTVNQNEYNFAQHNEFNRLTIINELDIHERLIGLLRDLSKIRQSNLFYHGISHGGFISIELSPFFTNIIYDVNASVNNSNQNDNLIENVVKYGIDNITTNTSLILNPSFTFILFNNSDIDIIIEGSILPAVIISKSKLTSNVFSEYETYILKDTSYTIYIKKDDFFEHFIQDFSYYIKDDGILAYDNLIHLCMIVKNAGDSFEYILNENLDCFDRWTILDTGSTDNTINIINNVLVGKKKGQLFQEPFVNFSASRNRCFELAGNDCKFLLTLDDTYIVKDNLRKFLETVRGDQFSNSFSLYIQSSDTEYTSNRVIKSDSGLRYIYKLHEVITPHNNNNVIIPMHHAHIFDYRSDYMEKRTMDRKKYDLKMLHEMAIEEPNDPRSFYYLAQTYNLLERYQSALVYFLKRINHPEDGFFQEKLDACFEAARICNFKLNKPWEECEELYKKAYSLDKTRPDSLYFLGIHYYQEQKFDIAYDYMKQAFEVGYPIHSQYSLKPTLSFYYLPKFLTGLCFMFENYSLGLESANLFLSKNQKTNENMIDHTIVTCWQKIHNQFLTIPDSIQQPLFRFADGNLPVFCMLADGGFNKWTGSDILRTGIGGSERFIIEMARHIQNLGLYNVIVFCNCSNEELFENVEYRDIKNYTEFIYQNDVEICLISRYPEYLPVTYKSKVNNVYLILHDLIPDGEIIIGDSKLKNIFCLTKWHCKTIQTMFPVFSDLITDFNYGIDIDTFENIKHINGIQKQPFKFIYSSFAHRGLLPLLQMWPKIIAKYPQAVLHIHCDINHPWVLNVRPDEMNLIKTLLTEYQTDNQKYHIIYEGWTTTEKLMTNWLSSDVWFYPCTFLETFCLTAFEAAASKTLAITTPLAALEETVGDRGILIEGDAYTTEWQDKALQQLFNILDNQLEKNKLIEANYKHVQTKTWKNRANDLIKILPRLKNQTDENKLFQEELQNIISYFIFTNSGKMKKQILEIGSSIVLNSTKLLSTLISNSEIKLLTKPIIDKEINREIEEEYCIIENEDFSDELIKQEKKHAQYNLILYQNSDANDVKIYLNLYLCYQILTINGIFIITNNHEIIHEIAHLFIKNKYFNLIENTKNCVCLQKLK